MLIELDNGRPDRLPCQVHGWMDYYLKHHFEATKDHAGYIISPSDHFFLGAPENIQAFADAAHECRY